MTNPLVARASRARLLAAVAALGWAGCGSTQTATVPAVGSDSTPPSAMWLQAALPGKPYLNVFLQDKSQPAPVTAEVSQTAVIKLTATATDNDSGIGLLEIGAFVTAATVDASGAWHKSKDLAPMSLGSFSVPLQFPRSAPLTAHVDATVDFGQLAAGADFYLLNISASAENGARTPGKTSTDVLSLYFKKAGTPPPP